MGATVTVTIDDRELVRLINASRGDITPMIVADGVEYGIYQELGQEGRPARPCARPAVESARPEFEAMFKTDEALTRSGVQGIVKKAASRVEILWKQNIQTKKVIDTGAYYGSVHVEEA